jgi:hypothetical protein
MIFRALIAVSLIGLFPLNHAAPGNLKHTSAPCGVACDVATGNPIAHEAMFRRLNQMRVEIREGRKNNAALQPAERDEP